MIGEQPGARPELILLGLPKTGTTWLASALAHLSAIDVFDESEKIEQLWGRPAALPVLIAESATDPLFLSSFNSRNATLAALGNRVPGRHHLLFLREPRDWVRSLYRQYVKRGGYRPFQEFFAPGDDSIVDPAFLNYEQLVEQLRTHLKGPLAIADYAYLRDDPHGFVTGILSAFGPESALSRLDGTIPERAYTHRANVGLRGRGGRWLRAFNRIRRSRWNPNGWFSWKRAERLPWHLVGSSGRDLLTASDERYLDDMASRHSDWEHWQPAFNESWLLRPDSGD